MDVKLVCLSVSRQTRVSRRHVFGDGVLRIVCRPNSEEVTQVWRKAQNEEDRHLCSSM